MRPSNSVYTTFSSIPGIIACALDIQGGALSVSATCASGGAAAYTGMQMLRSGEFDAVLVGCVDAPLIDSILKQLVVTGVLSSRCGNDALRPFDLHRDGTVLGEGAAFMLLESPAFALRRGAPVRGLLQAVTLNCESQSRSRPSDDGEGLQRAVRAALQQSSLAAAEVDLVHLHGTGTHLNDTVESRCVRSLFGEVRTQPVCWASKAITGHTFGASALFIAVLTLEAMRHSHVTATTNCFTPDPGCPIRLSLGKGEARPIRTAVCLTSGFWGNNACLVLRTAETPSSEGQPPA
jgi:3-oxoacyl-[acyl-carrier-protein] synthase II